MKREIAFCLTLAWSVTALIAPLPVAGAQEPWFPNSVALPAGFRPEGIAIGSAPTAYLGSQADGSIYRANLITGRGTLLSRGPGTPAMGLAIDNRGRLFVAGGAAGNARVVDARTGVLLASYQLGTSPGALVNDVVLTPEGAWFTDSHAPVLYHVPFGGAGELPPPEAVQRRPLLGEIRYVPDAFNANGIARTPDGKGLVLVQSVTGRLFRVVPDTGATRQIDLGGESLHDGDGLYLRGNTLFVVQNRTNAIAVVQLDRSSMTGTVLRHITDPRFDVPTTVAEFAGHLYLPNARFTTPATPTTTYSVVAVHPWSRP